MRVASLYSGIGGADLGWERGGHQIVAQAERDPWRRAVLGARFPGVPCAADVAESTAAADLLYIDLPADETNGLAWPDAARAVRAAGAAWVVVETGLGPIGTVVAGLAVAGYDVTVLHVDLTIAADYVPRRAWDVRRRQLVLAGNVAALALRTTLVPLTAQTTVLLGGPVEREEQSRALPAGWTCLCGQWVRPGACLCDERVRRHAVRDATSPALTRWLADVLDGTYRPGADYRREMERGAACAHQG
jgi:hypothetical protein